MPDLQVKLSAEATGRVREALVGKVLAERVDRINGCTPWDLLTREGATWEGPVTLNASLLEKLRPEFSSNVTREILLAAANVKLSRTCLTDDKVATLERLADQYGFRICVSQERYIHKPDSGKGGTSNQISGLADQTCEEGLRNVYVASEAGLAEAGKMLEEAGDDEIFGTLLGIPECCRHAFARNLAEASAKQTDFVLASLENTTGEIPFDPWLNYPASYFGAGLMSFFPCSYRCQSSARVAQVTYAALHDCNEWWARRFVAKLRTNVLYTEYDGLYLFKERFDRNIISYRQADILMTADGPLAALLRQGTHIEVLGRHSVAVFRGTKQIGEVSGPDTGFCCFY